MIQVCVSLFNNQLRDFSGHTQFVLMKSMYLDFGDAEVKVEGLLRQPEGREPIPVKKEEK
ncbi:hypothetical protein [Segatella sp.]|uniref:hypothetical protein n=1 Tax=Segatella sp. TaxID=2974253 RepID=UPI003AAA3E09